MGDGRDRAGPGLGGGRCAGPSGHAAGLQRRGGSGELAGHCQHERFEACGHRLLPYGRGAACGQQGQGGLDLLTGIAGQVSLGQAGFMAVGGYMSAILAVRYRIPTLLGLVIGMAGSALVATVLGLVCGRLRGMYLAITTLAFGILVEAMANGLSMTGGPSGIGGIPAFSVAGFAFDSDTRFFYLIWALVAVALILVANFVRSNRGRILRTMHGACVSGTC